MVCIGNLYFVIVQFFINLVDNCNFNYSGKILCGWGYMVFGEVVEGMDIVDWIVGVVIGSQCLNGQFVRDVFKEMVVIENVCCVDNF